MSLKKKIVKRIYPLLMWSAGIAKKNVQVLVNNRMKTPAAPFFFLHFILNDGTPVSFEKFRGKKIIVVNTASGCGYTPQYDSLKKLYEYHKNELVVLAFPSNNFGGQEPGSNEEIKKTCSMVYGITFPVMEKSSVAGAGRNEVFEWLANKNKNGWNDQEPIWNFCKYVINEEGTLTHFFGSSIDPLGPDMMRALK
jgi:glutathione peroxidase